MVCAYVCLWCFGVSAVIFVKFSYIIPLVYKSVFSLLVVVLVRVIPTTVVLQKKLKDQTGLTQIENDFVPLQIALEDNFFARCSYSFLPVHSKYKRALAVPICHFVWPCRAQFYYCTSLSDQLNDIIVISQFQNQGTQQVWQLLLITLWAIP